MIYTHRLRLTTVSRLNKKYPFSFLCVQHGAGFCVPGTLAAGDNNFGLEGLLRHFIYQHGNQSGEGIRLVKDTLS
ncbi:MAG: hypothetical protein V4557_15645 [Bacteroidota bacterium]